jgi:FkbM family methyltransferase
LKDFLNNALRRTFGVELVRSNMRVQLEHEAKDLRNQLMLARQEVVRSAAERAPFTMTEVFGSRMYANPDDRGLQIFGLSDVDPATLGGEVGYIVRNIHPGSVIVDCGANIGLLTLLLAKQAGPTGVVHAFEPGPISFGLLSANVGFNRMANVRLHNEAVSDQTGPIELNVCLSGESDNRIAGVVGIDKAEFYQISSRATRLDDAIKGPVDFIKLDVQGAEYRALLGARATIARSPRLHMVVEYAPVGLSQPAGEYLAFLRSMGFDIYDLPETGTEQAVTDSWILDNIGDLKPRESTNLVLKKKR